MLICIPEVLTKEQVAHCRKVMDKAEWVDGRVTAGAQSGSVKHNLQLPEGRLRRKQLGDMVLEAPVAQPALHFGGHPAHDLPAALQPLWRRPLISARTWTAPSAPMPGTPDQHPHRSVRDAVPGRAGGIRRRRA